VLLAACGDDGPDPKRTATKEKLPAGGYWLAVLKVEDDPNLLDADTQVLRKPAGKALVVAQVDCFEGLAARLDLEGVELSGDQDDTTAGTYILGLRGSTMKKINRLLKKVDREPVLTAGVTDRC
jgi:hypothetical protein